MNDDNAVTGGFDPNDLTTGQVVGIAVGAAFALGTVVAALGPNEPEKPPHSGGRRTVVRGAHSVVRENPSAASLAVVQNGKVSGRTRRRLEQEAAALQQEIDRLGKIAEKQERKEQPAVPAASVMLSVSGTESGEMADDRVVAVLKNGKLTRRSRKQLRAQADAIQKDIDRLDKAVRSASYRRAHPAPTTDDVRETASSLGQDASKRLSIAGAATTAALAPLLERAQGFEVPKGAQQAAERAQKNISQFASTTQKSAGQLADTAREQATKVQEQVPQIAERVRDEVLPQVTERLQQLRDEVLPQVVERAQQLRDDVTPQITDAATKVGTQASALAVTGVALGREKAKGLANTDLAADLTGRAKQQTHKGRKAAAKGLSALAAQIEPPKQRRNLSGLWAVAAVAAVGGGLYYVFGDEERRNKVIGTARSIVEQGREIVRDFRGYDEEF